MRRRETLVATGTAVATALAGCLGTNDETGTNSIDANDGGEASQDGANSTVVDENGASRTVIVSASGEVDGEPDLAVLHVGIESVADSAGVARDELASGAEDLTNALREYGIPDENISTRRFRIHERLDRQRMEEDGVRPDNREKAEEYITYHGTHSFTIEVENVDEVGEVIDVAVEAGADEIGHVTYTLSEEKRSDLREEALREALGSAREEADVIADEISAEVVEATIVDASEGRVSPVRRNVEFGDGAAAETPASEPAPPTAVESGDVTVTADVDVRYEIE